ncbi:MAG: sigma 54-interacting transcriptional regulator [Parahaliea sp.]
MDVIVKQHELWDVEDRDRVHRPGGNSGYVLDNMEGAVDRATFLARTHMPIAVIGARGTGKMYVARIVHQEVCGTQENLVVIDCRGFRNCESANQAITVALRDSRNRTLVFKYPHLMCMDAQQRLARQISSRILLDSQPPLPLSDVRFIALLPDSIERLLLAGQLQERLGSVFAGYPIFVPPIRDRLRAVLRWADKILQQECEARGTGALRFTPEAEQAMLAHSWEGNISEMRYRIGHALDSASEGWVNPMDLGLLGRQEDEETTAPEPIIDGFGSELSSQGSYRPTAGEALEYWLAEAAHHTLSGKRPYPLGTWLEDEVVLAAVQYHNGQVARAARSLQTGSRNVQRWLPRIAERDQQRRDSMLWKTMRERVGTWVDELVIAGDNPLARARDLLLQQLEQQGDGVSVKIRAAIMGVSVPTYNKRLKQLLENG